jgi:hypothetical protein
MIARVNLWVVCGVLLAGCVFTSSAHAQFLSGGGYGLGFFNYGQNDGFNQNRIPYYALYPPVYYSYPVARPYGYSPFAYPPGTMTPQAAPQAAAVEYRNPFVPSDSNPQPAADKSASVPRTYINPYVVQARAASSEPLLSRVE